MDLSASSMETSQESQESQEAISSDIPQPVFSNSSADKGLSSDKHGRSSRRKPIKTHKVSANFEEVDHYNDYLRDGSPDALLEGIGFKQFNEQMFESVSHSQMEDGSMLIQPSPESTDGRSGHTAGKRRGRPPGRGSRGRGTPLQPIVIAPTPPSGKRRGRPPKTATSDRGQSVHTTPASASFTPVHVTPILVPQSKRLPAQPSPAIVPIVLTPVSMKPVPIQPARLRNQSDMTPIILPSTQCISDIAALAALPVTEFNVWPVLEKLLAATQSMGMLLGSLKDDLKRTSAMIAASAVGSSSVDHTRKRREVATKLWRAFVAYKKSFDEIESFTRNTGVNSMDGIVNNAASVSGTVPNASHTLPVRSPPSSVQPVQNTSPAVVSSTATASSQPTSVSRRRPRSVQTNVVIELSDSDDDKADGDKSPVRKQFKTEDCATICDVSKSNGRDQQSTVETDSTGAAGELLDMSSTENGHLKDDNRVASRTVDVAPDNMDVTGSTYETTTTVSFVPNVAEIVTSVYRPENRDTENNRDAENETSVDEQCDGVRGKDTAAATETSTDYETSVKVDSSPSADLKNMESKSPDVTKANLFSCLHFEPLFEIKPLNDHQS